MKTLVYANHDLRELLPVSIRRLLTADNVKRDDSGRMIVSSHDTEHQSKLIAALRHHNFKFEDID